MRCGRVRLLGIVAMTVAVLTVLDDIVCLMHARHGNTLDVTGDKCS